MSAILKKNIRGAIARQFFSSLYNGDNTLYLVLGREAAWLDERNPPVPTQSIEDESSFREHMICGVRIKPQNMSLVVPRKNWEVEGMYNLLDTTSNNPYDAGDFYCYSQSSDNVYLLVGKNDPNGHGPQIGQEPVDRDKNIEIGNYTWSYLYNITANMASNNLLIENWLPVPYSKTGTGGNLTSDQIRYGGNEGIFAAETLGAHTILFSVTLSDVEGDFLPEDIQFRQIGIIMNPKNGNTYISGDQFTASGITRSSGTLIYLENRTPITRTQGQQEIIQVIISM